MGSKSKPLAPYESFPQHYGWRIRAEREKRGWTLEELGERLHCDKSQVSRYEHGETIPPPPAATLLDATFGTDYFTEHREVATRERIPLPARNLAEHEASARVIREVATTIVPGLMQCESYIRACALRGARPQLEDEVVAERLRRQEILVGEGRPVRFVGLIEETALHRDIGGPEVLREQLDALLVRGSMWNVTLQIIPASRKAYPGVEAGFSLLDDHDGTLVAWQEGAAGTGRVVEDPAIVYRLDEAFDLARALALPVDESLQLIKMIQESL